MGLRSVPAGRQPKQEQAPSAFRRLVSDAAVWVALLTGGAYAVALIYEGSYCQYFHIPSYVIVPNTNTVVFALAILGAAVLGIAQLVASMRYVTEGYSLPRRLRLRLEMLAVFWLLLLLSANVSWTAYFVVGGTTFLFLAEYVGSLLTRKGPWLLRLYVAEASVIESDKKPDPLARMFDSLPTPIALTLLASLFVGMFASALGSVTARFQETFQMLDARPDVAVVRMYGDMFVGVKLNDARTAATGEVVLFKLGDEFKQVNLREQRLGRIAASTTEALRK